MCGRSTRGTACVQGAQGPRAHVRVGGAGQIQHRCKEHDGQEHACVYEENTEHSSSAD